jgi:hypothetical protein
VVEGTWRLVVSGQVGELPPINCRYPNLMSFAVTSYSNIHNKQKELSILRRNTYEEEQMVVWVDGIRLVA